MSTAAVLVATAPATLGASTVVSDRDTTEPEATGLVKPSPITVERTTLTLVDPSRATPSNGDYAGAPHRTLMTTVSYPARRGTPLPGPLPLVVFATGIGGDSLNYAPMYDHWVEAGYVVAAPTFPLSSKNAPGGETLSDLVNQPDDIRFVTTAVLKQGRTRKSPLVGLIDQHRIALVGKSLGAITVFETAYATADPDTRFRAVIALTGVVGGSGPHFTGIDTPLLLEHGDADTTVPHDGSVKAYAAAEPPKYFVTLLGQTHGSAFGGGATPAEQVVERTVVDFLDRYVQGQRAARSRLLHDGDVPGVATIQHQT